MRGSRLALVQLDAKAVEFRFVQPAGTDRHRPAGDHPRRRSRNDESRATQHPADMALHRRLGNLRGSLVRLPAIGNQSAETIDSAAHDLEILVGSGELSHCALAVEQTHRMLDRVGLLEDIGYRLAQLVLVGSSNRSHE